MKKFLCLAIVVIMSMCSSPVFAHEPNSEIISLSDTHSFTTSKETSLTQFNEDVLNDYANFDVIETTFQILSSMDKDSLIQLIDNGKILWVENDGHSINDIFEILGLPKQDQEFKTKGVYVTGIYIYNINNQYCAGITGNIGSVDSNDEAAMDKLQEFENNFDELPYKAVEKANDPESIDLLGVDFSCKVKSDEFVNSVREVKREYLKRAQGYVDPDTVYVQLPSKSFDGSPWSGYFTPSVSLSYSITQYRYDICTYNSGGVEKSVADVVSDFSVAPDSSALVKYYNTRIHCNISNMNCIGASRLDSDKTTSYTLSGGFTADAGGVTSGSASGSTSNSFSANSQIITNAHTAQKYKDWNVDPIDDWVGQTWGIEPAIRVTNNNNSSYNSQAYSSVRKSAITNTSGSFGATYTTPYEIGGSWSQ